MACLLFTVVADTLSLERIAEACTGQQFIANLFVEMHAIYFSCRPLFFPQAPPLGGSPVFQQEHTGIFPGFAAQNLVFYPETRSQQISLGLATI